MQSLPKAFIQFKRAVCILGISIFAGVVVHVVSDAHDPLELGIFFLLILLGELLPITFSSLSDTLSEVTMTMPVTIALLVSHGPAEMIAVSFVSMSTAYAVTCRKRYNLRSLVDLACFNGSMSTLSNAAGSLAYVLVGGTTLARTGDITLLVVIFPLLAWVFTCTTMNLLVITTAQFLLTGEPWRVLGMQNIRWTVPSYLITGPSGILFAYLYMKYGIYGVLLVIIPFLVGRQALNQYATQLRTYRETITTLGAYMQHYHPYTKGHLERVADLSDKIAKHMGLPVQSLMFIRDAGMLHDIGKVGVSEEILDKIGKLTDEEWSTIKQHPARGAEILSQMKYLEHIVPWVRGHHERPDGRGYPDGLQDGQIPPEAAIIAVADAFDAMTGGLDEKDKRVYRTQLTIDQALAQVRYGIGTQFAAPAVKAFLRVLAREEMERGE